MKINDLSKVTIVTDPGEMAAFYIDGNLVEECEKCELGEKLIDYLDISYVLTELDVEDGFPDTTEKLYTWERFWATKDFVGYSQWGGDIYKDRETGKFYDNHQTEVPEDEIVRM